MAAEPPPGTAKTLCGPGNGVPGSESKSRVRCCCARPGSPPRGHAVQAALQRGRAPPPVASPARTDGLGVGHLAETAASRAIDSRPSVDRAERALLPGAPPAFLLSCALSVHVVTHFSIGLLVFSLFRKIFFKY